MRAVTVNTATTDQDAKQHGNSTIDLSIVIASFNSRKTILKTLDALANQKTTYRFEIIVVDSSNDGTDEVIADYFPNVNVIRLPRQTYPGSGRNIGVQYARGTYVAFTDSDCLPQPDWVDNIIRTFERVQSDAVGGCLTNGFRRSVMAWVSHLIEFNEWTETTPERYVTNIPSANLAYKRSTFEQFNEYFPDYLGSEDTILNWRMQKKGVKIYFNPKIKVVHLNRVGLKKLFGHQYMLGRWSAEARRTEDLPGKLFARYRILTLVLPLIRWARAFARLVRKDVPKLAIFVAITPIYLVAAFTWSLGFLSNKELTYSKIPVTSADLIQA
ncbi:glycosyltransferase [candidate division KSB1 bacterium]|nr:glycosyltransferase [candidate division KSB1 bacterium]NIR72186.1 glycosyltransferase [candidate division KSB1 bacterium]NIS26651.1 glycosyltransferase [candidate division KSB1 bacterium]NIT73419.1 glycosyltransferase [candidate division KSB1 bacterium]NIU27267.1 glycosyltransferase [candidate division KSB1 bacterium]